MEILNTLWFDCKIGIVTIKKGESIKTYIKSISGIDRDADIKEIITWGCKIDTDSLQKILDFHNLNSKN